jgi:ABC-2 type transport system ATP-binding protein
MIARVGDEAIEVMGLRVRLRQERNRVRSLKEYVVSRVGRARLAARWFDALEDVSFNVGRGEIFAIIGPNGAGKTTLLRVLAGIVPPSAGSVIVRGRVAPMIELGAGFDPELTGDENVLLYGSLLGMSRRQARERRQAIMEFAGIGDVMDVAVKNYSSGMVARLGFAVATEAAPNVLLVDEVLAVGDDVFRRRCSERIARLRGQGTSVVLVSHDLALVEGQADRAMLIEAGRVVASGPAPEVTETYRRRQVA